MADLRRISFGHRELVPSMAMSSLWTTRLFSRRRASAWSLRSRFGPIEPISAFSAYGAIYVADVETGELRVLTWLDPILTGTSAPSFAVAAWQDGDWRSLGTATARRGSLDLSALVTPEASAIRLRPSSGGPE